MANLTLEFDMISFVSHPLYITYMIAYQEALHCLEREGGGGGRARRDFESKFNLVATL